MAKFLLGLANYSPEQWVLLKKVADDPERLDDSYKDWIEGRDKALRHFKELGQPVRLVEINVGDLLNWCRAHGRKLDGKARAEFCSEKLREIDGQPDGGVERR